MPEPLRQDPETRKLTTDLPPVSGTPVLDVRPTPHAPEPGPAVPPGYELHERVGRGGMGDVYRAREVAFDRDVAVKFLSDRFPTPSPGARRFLDEARITGQLQHPGIPPVHHVGTLPDGRPFLAMKLIRGRTLAELLARRADPSADRGRFLAVLEDICQAVAYAHDRGVIHRDLKPSNVMVGAFGEVQVMDWGLAKELAAETAAGAHQKDEPPTADAAVSDPERTTDHRPPDASTDDRTRTGQAMGTPAYMPPEQARGEVDRVGPRSDVFALGGILCEMLTGRPPYAGSGADVLRRAAAGDLGDAFSRLDAVAGEAELVAVCRRCLAPAPGDRFADAGEVADAVSRLRSAAEERARQAERERAAAEARAAEQRRKRRWQLAAAGAVLLLFAGGGAFAWYSDREAQARAGAERVRHTRNAADLAALLSRCEDALNAGDATRAAVALEAAEKRAAEGGGEELADRLARLRTDLAILQELDAVDEFRWLAVDVNNNYRSPEEVVNRLRPALERFGVNPDVSDPQEVSGRVTGSVVRERLIGALDLTLLIGKSPRVRDVLRSVDSNPARNAVRDAFAAGKVPDLAILKDRVPVSAQPARFVAIIGDAPGVPVELRRSLMESGVARQPNNLALLMNLGNSYRTRGVVMAGQTSPIPGPSGAELRDIEGRLRWFQAAVAAAPRSAAARSNLGLAYLALNDRDRAEDCLRQVVGLYPGVAFAHHNLGVALSVQGKWDEAVACFRKAIELDPGDPSPRNSLGITLREMGDLTGAVAQYAEAIRISPNNGGFHYHLGRSLHDLRKFDEAIAAYRESIRLDPNRATAHAYLGMALKDRGDRAGAKAEYLEALRLSQNDPIAHSNLGVLLFNEGSLDEAEYHFREAIRIAPEITGAHYYLGTILGRKNDPEGAVVYLREAVKRNQKHAEAHTNLGIDLTRVGELDEAITCFKAALDINPKLVNAIQGLRRAERMQELLPRLPEAVAGTAKPRSPTEGCEFARLCTEPFQKRYADAVRLYEWAFAAEPKLAGGNSFHPYFAVGAALHAARGEGVGAPADLAERAALRRKALSWMRTEHAYWAKYASSPNPAARQSAAGAMRFWLRDGELASVRQGLLRIGVPAAERAAWDEFWNSVRATLAEAEKPAGPPTKPWGVAPPPREVRRP